MDANEYALKVGPAEKSLGLVLRQAEWTGNGKSSRKESESASGEAPPPRACEAARALAPHSRRKKLSKKHAVDAGVAQSSPLSL